MKSILDPTFAYTNSCSTDLGKVFAKERERLFAEAAAKIAVQAERAKDTAVIVANFNARRGK